MKIPVAGGTPMLICDLPSSEQQPSWAADDTIWVGSRKGLSRVPANGGTLEAVTTAKSEEEGHFSPEALPGGKAILFSVSTGLSKDASRIAVLDLQSHAYRTIVNAGHSARYVRTGYLAFLRGKTLFAVPFDVKRLAVTGAENVAMAGIESPPYHQSPYAFFDSSLLVFEQADPTKDYPSSLEIVDRRGTVRPLPDTEQRWGSFDLSTNGNLLAASIENDSGKDIWIYNLERRPMTRLTFEGTNLGPLWSPSIRRRSISAPYR